MCRVTNPFSRHAARHRVLLRDAAQLLKKISGKILGQTELSFKWCLHDSVDTDFGFTMQFSLDLCIFITTLLFCY